MHIIWWHIWKLIQEKNQTSATNVTLHVKGQKAWGGIWKPTLDILNLITTIFDSFNPLANNVWHLIFNNIWYLIISMFHPFNSPDWRQSSLRWYHSLPLDRLRPPVFLTYRKKAFCKFADTDIQNFVLSCCTNFDCYYFAHFTSYKFCNIDRRHNSLYVLLQFSSTQWAYTSLLWIICTIYYTLNVAILKLCIFYIVQFANLALMTEYKVAFASISRSTRSASMTMHILTQW